MSHNKIKVASQEPNNNSDVTISLDDLSNTNITNVQNSDLLKFDDPNFVNSAPASSMFLHLGYFQHYFYTWSASYTYLINDYNVVRDDPSTGETYGAASLFNNATQTNSPLNNSKWSESYDITAGTYLCIWSAHCRNATNCVWQWHNDSGPFGAKTYVDNANNFGALVVGICTVAGNDKVRTVLTSANGTVFISNGKTMNVQGITIIKLS